MVMPSIQEAIKDPETFENLRVQVVDRALRYHRRCLPDQFLNENMREWEELCDLCEARFGTEKNVPKRPRPPYPFDGLLDHYADEWSDKSFYIGGLDSLRDDPTIAGGLERWIRKAQARNKNRNRVSESVTLVPFCAF